MFYLSTSLFTYELSHYNAKYLIVCHRSYGTGWAVIPQDIVPTHHNRITRQALYL